jgi:NDP-sugar pyrophosphorylase family protein
VHRFIKETGWRPDYVHDNAWPAEAVGRNCHIGQDVVLENTIVWDDAEIASGAQLRGCIVRDHCVATGVHADQDF